MSDNPHHVLCVLSDEQRADYAAELQKLECPGVALVFHNSPEDAFDQVDKLSPVLVIVGMTVGPLKGRDLLVLLLKRFPDFDKKMVVLPDKGDPFPIVVDSRDHITGHSKTEEIEFSQLADLIRDAAPSSTVLGLGVPEQLLDETDDQWQIPDEPARDGKPDTSYFQVGRRKESLAPDSKKPQKTRPSTAPIRETRAANVFRESTPDPRVDPAPASKPTNATKVRPGSRASNQEDRRLEYLTQLVEPAPVAPAGAPMLITQAAPGPVPASQRMRLIAIGVAGGVVVSLVMYLLLSGGNNPVSKPVVNVAAPDGAPQPTPQVAGDATATTAVVAATQPDATAKTSHTVAASEIDTPISLPISFIQGQAEYAVIDATALDKVLENFRGAMQESPDALLEIGGHTSDDGVPEFNQQLAGRRATMVRLLLRRRRFPMRRVFIKSYGAAMIDHSNTAQMGNRRVTLRLVE